jgi:hypothetical protein
VSSDAISITPRSSRSRHGRSWCRTSANR